MKLKQLRLFAFLVVSILILRFAGASITDGKNPPPSPAANPELWQIPWDVETGKPRNVVIGAPGFTILPGPVVSGYNATNVYISIEMQGLFDLLEELENE